MSFSSKLFKRFLCELQEAPGQLMNLGKLREKLNARPKVFKTAYKSLKDSGEIEITGVISGKYSRSVNQMNVSLVKSKSSRTTVEELDDDDSQIPLSESDFKFGPKVLERPCLYQAYNVIVQNEGRGVSQAELRQFLKSVGKSQVERIIKGLTQRDLVDEVFIDRGRQRIRMYTPKDVSNNGSMSKEFNMEKKKMQQLVLSTKKDSSVGCTDQAQASAPTSSIRQMQHFAPDTKKDQSIISKPDTNNLKRRDANLTAHKMKRHNIILEHINKEKAVTEYRTFLNLIQAAEKRNGYKEVMDSRSVKNLLNIMSTNRVLHHTKITISHGDVTENLDLISSLDCPDSVLTSAIDQAKFKLALKEQNRVARMIKIEESPVPSNTMTNRFLRPKFIKLRSLHQFFWYLAYGHPHSTEGSSEIIESNTPKMYDENLSWKRYLPPARIHMIKGLPWLQVAELALKLPLSVICQFHTVRVMSEELKSFLLDEDRCHTLVRHLPPSVWCLFLDKRNYMLSLSECIEKLFFMGLITIRRSESAHKPNLLKENMMIYVHKNCTVVDTRTSGGKRYMKVEDKEYEKLHYVLDEFQDVESFWYQLKAVCMQTKLGGKEMSEVDSLHDNRHLGDTTVKKFVKDSFKCPPDPVDDGSVPGDGLGAGGIDSSMFSSRCKNWYSSQTININYHDSHSNELVPFQRKYLDTSEKLPSLNVKRPRRSRSSRKNNDDTDCNPPAPKRSKTIPSTVLLIEAGDVAVETANHSKNDKTHCTNPNILPKAPIDQTDLTSSSMQQSNNEMTPKVVIESNVGRNERVKGGRGLKRKPTDPLAQELQTFSSLGITKRRRRHKQQPMDFIQHGKQRVKYVDKVDLDAIKSRKGRIRTVFSKEEDSLFLLCHVTTSLLIKLYWKKPFPPRKQIIPWSVVRDIAYRYLSKSHDKTSDSVRRRTRVIMKNPETRICHDISVADIKSDVAFLKRFCPPELNLKTESTKVHELYRNLVDQLRKRFETQPGLFCVELPDTNEHLLQQYTPQTILCKNEDIVSRRTYFEDEIHDSADIKKSIAENVIFIALTMSDSEFSIYQAHRALEEYTESVVNDVFMRMSLSGFICRNKTAQRTAPGSIRNHRLTQAHTRSLQASVPRLLLDKVAKALETTTDIEVKTTSSVEAIFLTSYFWTKKVLDISIDIPEQVVTPKTSNTPVFENQFQAMLQSAEEDLLNKLNDLQGQDFEGGAVPSDSLMAAVWTNLKENSDGDTKRGDDNETVPDASDKKLKIAKLIRLYYRHPSYTNWLTLIKPRRRTESKFASLNLSSTSDCIVLTPCKIKIHNVADMSAEFCHNSSTKQILKLKQLLASRHVHVTDFEAEWQSSNQEKIDTQSFVMTAIFNSVDKSSYRGITKPELLQSVPFDQGTANHTLNKLFEHNFVFAVGIKEQRIVSFRNVSHWTAKGFKFNNPTVNFQSKIQLFQNGNSSQGKGNNASSDVMPVGERIQGRYEDVKFICRPWHSLCGDICFSAAKSLLTSVFMKVYSSPGITQEAICATFIYQRVCILELLAILRDTDCVYEKTIEYPRVKRLFGMLSPAKTVVYYEATDDGLVILSQWVTIANKLISMSSTQDSNA